jgi:hypothetical protein
VFCLKCSWSELQLRLLIRHSNCRILESFPLVLCTRMRFHLCQVETGGYGMLHPTGHFRVVYLISRSFHSNICLNYSRLSLVSMVMNRSFNRCYWNIQLQNFFINCHFITYKKSSHRRSRIEIRHQDHYVWAFIHQASVHKAFSFLCQCEQMSNFYRTCTDHLFHRICIAMSCSCCRECSAFSSSVLLGEAIKQNNIIR